MGWKTGRTASRWSSQCVAHRSRVRLGVLLRRRSGRRRGRRRRSTTAARAARCAERPAPATDPPGTAQRNRRRAACGTPHGVGKRVGDLSRHDLGSHAIESIASARGCHSGASRYAILADARCLKRARRIGRGHASGGRSGSRGRRPEAASGRLAAGAGARGPRLRDALDRAGGLPRLRRGCGTRRARRPRRARPDRLRQRRGSVYRRKQAAGYSRRALPRHVLGRAGRAARRRQRAGPWRARHRPGAGRGAGHLVSCRSIHATPNATCAG